jgi:hypothetical protein
LKHAHGGGGSWWAKVDSGTMGSGRIIAGDCKRDKPPNNLYKAFLRRGGTNDCLSHIIRLTHDGVVVVFPADKTERTCLRADERGSRAAGRTTVKGDSSEVEEDVLRYFVFSSLDKRLLHYYRRAVCQENS